MTRSREAAGGHSPGLWIRLKAFIVWLVARLVLLTLRLKVSGEENLDLAGASNGPFIYAFWHGKQLALFRANPARRLTVLASLSRDGEMQARICKRFGIEVVRGSSSRGGLSGMLALSRRLQDGSSVAMAVDGPRGPACEAKPGVVALASRTGCSIVPVSAGFKSRKRLSRAWDRFEIPLPFTLCQVTFGEPLRVEADATPQGMSQIAKQLTGTLNRLSAEVDAVGSGG